MLTTVCSFLLLCDIDLGTHQVSILVYNNFELAPFTQYTLQIRKWQSLFQFLLKKIIYIFVGYYLTRIGIAGLTPSSLDVHRCHKKAVNINASIISTVHFCEVLLILQQLVTLGLIWTNLRDCFTIVWLLLLTTWPTYACLFVTYFMFVFYTAHKSKKPSPVYTLVE